jgi:hypothetical protein
LEGQDDQKEANERQRLEKQGEREARLLLHLSRKTPSPTKPTKEKPSSLVSAQTEQLLKDFFDETPIDSSNYEPKKRRKGW